MTPNTNNKDDNDRATVFHIILHHYMQRISHLEGQLEERTREIGELRQELEELIRENGELRQRGRRIIRCATTGRRMRVRVGVEAEPYDELIAQLRQRNQELEAERNELRQRNQELEAELQQHEEEETD